MVRIGAILTFFFGFISMKIVSVILTALFLGLSAFSFSTFLMWDSLHSNPRIFESVLYSIKFRMLIVSLVIVFFFIISLFCTIKKRYRLNIILFVLFILLFVASSVVTHNG